MWEYRTWLPELPPNAETPVMDDRMMATWLNDMDARGWEFVSVGQKHWHDGQVQSWWIFRRTWTSPKPKPSQKRKGKR